MSTNLDTFQIPITKMLSMSFLVPSIISIAVQTPLSLFRAQG